jgi:hypothetical protein
MDRRAFLSAIIPATIVGSCAPTLAALAPAVTPDVYLAAAEKILPHNAIPFTESLWLHTWRHTTDRAWVRKVVCGAEFDYAEQHRNMKWLYAEPC